MMSEVPFTEAGGCVTLLLQVVGDGVLGRVQSGRRFGKQHPWCMPTRFG